MHGESPLPPSPCVPPGELLQPNLQCVCPQSQYSPTPPSPQQPAPTPVLQHLPAAEDEEEERGCGYLRLRCLDLQRPDLQDSVGAGAVEEGRLWRRTRRREKKAPSLWQQRSRASIGVESARWRRGASLAGAPSLGQRESRRHAPRWRQSGELGGGSPRGRPARRRGGACGRERDRGGIGGCWIWRLEIKI